jgi:hypothetical protein
MVSVALLSSTLQAQTLVRYRISTANSFKSAVISPTSVPANLTASVLSATGLEPLWFDNGFDGHFLFRHWQEGSAPVPNDKYISFTVTPTPGYQIDFSLITYTVGSRVPGASWQLRSSVDNYTSSFATHVTQPGPDADQYVFSDNASSLGAQTGPVTFRLYGFNEVSTNYSGLLNNRGFFGGQEGRDLTVDGTLTLITSVPPSATFVAKDTTTQGNWKGVYGANGYNVINHSVNYPSYATATPTGQANYTWASSTSNVRALQKPASTTDRFAGCWYSSTSFTVDLNLTDGLLHRVALYCLDWDTTVRSETIEILNASNNSVLSSQSVTAFNGGQYLVWDLKGHVIIRLTKTGSFNAVLGGLFFDTPAPPTATSATFVGKDTATQGSWGGVYSVDGHHIINHSVNYPSYAIATPSGNVPYTWASSTSDVRALRKKGATTDRIAACWYSTSNFALDLNLTDGINHRVSLYFLDWDTNARSERIDILDAFNNSVLSSQDVSAFNGGQYLIWNIKGHVIIRLTRTGAYNAVLSGIFFDPVPGGSPQSVSASERSSGLVSMHSARLRDGAFELELEGADQQSFVVEASTDLIHWIAMSNTPVGGQLADREAGRFQQRFYRVVRNGGIVDPATELGLK